MKTTIDVPDALYRRLKIRAAQSGVTIRHLVIRGIEQQLGEGPRQESGGSENRRDAGQRHSYVDDQGWPVLKRQPHDHRAITNDLINRLREQEGV